MQDLNQLCQTYHGIKNQIKILDAQADDLALKIIESTGHDHIGQKTYDDF
jgi:prefoldin subunit 5